MTLIRAVGFDIGVVVCMWDSELLGFPHALDAISLGLAYIVYIFSAYLLKMPVVVLTVMFSTPIQRIWR